MKERTAIVTGAASGIGRAIATDLCAQGARVLFADVNVEEGGVTGATQVIDAGWTAR